MNFVGLLHGNILKKADFFNNWLTFNLIFLIIDLHWLSISTNVLEEVPKSPAFVEVKFLVKRTFGESFIHTKILYPNNKNKQTFPNKK